MGRPKGSKNREIITDTADENIDECEHDEDYCKPQYIIVQHGTQIGLQSMICALINDYICQGGVSITNYRGLDGNIVMVYAQAMVRRDS